MNKIRGRVKELPPPDARSQQELSEVAEAPRSGGSSKRWRKLDQVGEREKRKEILSKCSKINFRKKEHTHTNIKKQKKNDTISKHPQMSTCKMIVCRATVLQTKTKLPPLSWMAEMVAEAHFARTTLGSLRLG